MIKLADLIKELEKPEQIYAPGYGPEDEDDDFLKRGFRTKGTTVDPETGAISSEIEYLPPFDKIKKDLGEMAKMIRPLKHMLDPDIADTSKKLITALNKARELTGVVDGLIKLKKK